MISLKSCVVLLPPLIAKVSNRVGKVIKILNEANVNFFLQFGSYLNLDKLFDLDPT